jgi:tetratricopeptide (TPR) repeat protein
MLSEDPKLLALVTEGVECARRDELDRALQLLSKAGELKPAMDTFPGLFYSYFGYCLAKLRGKLDEGLRLCDHAVKLQFYEAENHFNHARVLLLRGERRAAVRALAMGEKFDPYHIGIAALRAEIGVRGPRTIEGLARGHVVNRMLGHLRHVFRRS